MDLLKGLLYTLSRIGLMILLAVFSGFFGAVLVPSLMTFLPYSMIDVKNFFISPTTCSVLGMIIVAAAFAVIFYTDGKKHAAYENWSAVNITAVLLIMLFVYFVPAIFRDSFNAEGKAKLFYKILYYPCGWLYNSLNVNFLVSVVVGMGIILFVSLIMYVISFRIYVKKHPSILHDMK